MKKRDLVPIIILIVFAVGFSLFSYTPQADESTTGKTIENLGPIAFTSHLGRRGFYMHPTTNTPHLLMMYDPDYPNKEYRIVDVDLVKQTVRSANGSLGRTSVQGAVLHSNGKLYLTSSSPNYLIEYDPNTGITKNLQQLADNTGYIMIEGDDHALYIGGANKAILERYDPATGTYTNYGKATGTENTRWVYYLGADSRYMYAAIGQLNWYLVILDRQTGQQQTYWDDLDPSRIQIIQGQDGWYAQRTNANGSRTNFKLVDGSPTQLAATAKIPPVNPAPQLRFCPSVANTCASHYVADLDLSRAMPESTSINEPLATYRWQNKGETTWKSASARIPVEQQNIQQLVANTDGSLTGSTSFYGPIFTFNTTTQKPTILGITQRNIYDLISLPDKRRIFMSGYPSSQMTYNTDYPWDVTVESNILNRTTNPQQLGSHGKYIYFQTRDSDGFVYSAVQHERDSVGSEVIWFNPYNGASDSLRAPFAEVNARDIKAINNGKQIVFVGKPRDPQQQMTLFVIDVTTKKVVKTLIPTQDNVTMTKIAESPTEPGYIFGITEKTYYKIEAATGKVVYNKPHNGTPFPGQNLHDYRLTTGPDGWIWLSFLPKGTQTRLLTRINPVDGEFDVKQAVAGMGNVVFQYNPATTAYDAYLYGGGQKNVLRRISGLIDGEPRATITLAVAANGTTESGTYRYTVTAKNTSTQNATNVRIAYPIHPRMRFVSANEGGAEQGSDAVWTLPTLAAGAEKTLTVEFNRIEVK